MSGFPKGLPLAGGTMTGPIVLKAGNTLDNPHIAGADTGYGLLVTQETASGAGISVGNSAAGDGIYVQTEETTGTPGNTGNAINVWTGNSGNLTATGTGININRYGLGPALQITGEAGSGTGSASALVNISQNVNFNSIFILDAGVTTGNIVGATCTALTSGTIFNFYHANSAFSGDGLQFNFGNGAGSFSGLFCNFAVAGTTVFQVTSGGVAYANGFNTALGATASTPTFANGTAAQLAQTSKDAMVYLTVGTAGTAMVITIGPTSTPANTVVSSSVATAGELYSIRLPAGWYLKWSATTATIANQLAVTC